MPERFLLQILRNLVTHGILRSSRGVDGGYTLIKAPDEISLLDIIEAIEGPMGESTELGDGLNEAAGMRLEGALAEVTDTARRQLEAIKFSQLLQAPDAPAEQTPADDSTDAPSQGDSSNSGEA